MRCPYLGTDRETEHCRRPSKNISGLKKHLSRQHGGWTEDQIAAAIAAEPQGAAPSQSRLIADDGDAESTETSSSASPSLSAVPDAPKRERAVARKAKKASQELSDALDGIKNSFCEMIPMMTVGFLESKFGIVGTLNEKSAASVSKLWSAYFASLGLELELEETPTKIKVKNRTVKFLMPFVIGMYTLLTMSGLHKVPIDKTPAATPPQSEPLLVPEPPPEEPPNATQV